MILRRSQVCRGYAFGIEFLGFAVIGYSLYRIVSGAGHPLWLVPAALMIVAGQLTLSIPGINSRISMGETLVFLSLILFGPEAGALTAALDGLSSSMSLHRGPRRAEYTIFNTAALALSAYAAGQLFFLLLGRPAIFGGPKVMLATVILPAAAMALAHYLINSAVVAGIVALEACRNFFQIWCRNFLWSLAAYCGAAGISLVAVILTTRSVPQGVVFAIGSLLVVYWISRIYLHRARHDIRASA